MKKPLLWTVAAIAAAIAIGLAAPVAAGTPPCQGSSESQSTSVGRPSLLLASGAQCVLNCRSRQSNCKARCKTSSCRSICDSTYSNCVSRCVNK